MPKPTKEQEKALKAFSAAMEVEFTAFVRRMLPHIEGTPIDLGDEDSNAAFILSYAHRLSAKTLRVMQGKD